LIIGITFVLGIIIILFNQGMTQIVNTSCSHGPSCSMYGTIKTQTYIGIALLLVILAIGIVIMFSKPEIIEKIKKVEKEVKRKPLDYSKLDKDEKVLIKILDQSEGTIFQAELVEKSGMDKVKVTRILDRLEGRQLIERKRRGMSNIVILR